MPTNFFSSLSLLKYLYFTFVGRPLAVFTLVLAAGQPHHMNHFLFSPPLLKALTSLLPDPEAPREAWPHRPQAPPPSGNSPSLQVKSVLSFLPFCSKQYPPGIVGINNPLQLFWYVVPGPIPSLWLASPLHTHFSGSERVARTGHGVGWGAGGRPGLPDLEDRTGQCDPAPLGPTSLHPAPPRRELREPAAPCPAPTFWAVGKPPLQLARCIGEPGGRWQGKLLPPTT